MCHGNLVWSGSSFFLHGPNLAVEKYKFQKGPFLQWPHQVQIEIALLSKHELTTNQIYWRKEMDVQILLTHCPRICASQNTWCDCFRGFKKLQDYFLIYGFLHWAPSLPPRTKQHSTSVNWSPVQKKVLCWCDKGWHTWKKPWQWQAVSDTSLQTFPSLLKGTQKLMRKLRRAQ